VRDSIEHLVERTEELLDRLERMWLPGEHATSWDHLAYRWRNPTGLEPVTHPHRVELDDLLCMDQQKREISRNTAQFVKGKPANNVLLSGSRGTGKSSLIKAVFNALSGEGLRLIEVEKQDLLALPDIVKQLYDRPERFILYCDDLSFEANEPSYKSLKAALDGSIASTPENVLVYATSNRRHLLAEYQRENLESAMVDGEIHHGEGVEEKISLSERFGLWLSFYPYTQDQYLAIVHHWLNRFGADDVDWTEAREAALRWALQRGSRSGRVAWQFARDRAGRLDT
jgi:predicted AAA+ superfamily ATPase